MENLGKNGIYGKFPTSALLAKKEHLGSWHAHQKQCDDPQDKDKRVTFWEMHILLDLVFNKRR